MQVVTGWPLDLCVSWGGKLACPCRLLTFDKVTDCSVLKESIRKESIKNIVERQTHEHEGKLEKTFVLSPDLMMVFHSKAVAGAKNVSFCVSCGLSTN